MKKISNIVIIIAVLLIIASLVIIFQRNKNNNMKEKEIKWEIIKEETIEKPTEYTINDYKETIVTYDDKDFSIIKPNNLLVDKLSGNVSYYGKNITIEFSSTKATADEFSDNLKTRCTDLYEKCTLKKAKLDSKSYAFLQETFNNNTYQEDLIILSNEIVVNYHLIDSSFSDKDKDKVLKSFNYEEIPEGKYSHCNNGTCTLDLKDVVGSTFNFNYDSSSYKVIDYNVNNSSELFFTNIKDPSLENSPTVRYIVRYNSKADAINEVDLNGYEFDSDMKVNNKTLKHYSSFYGDTRETADEFIDLYLDIINPNLLIEITVDSFNENDANKIINEFTNYEVK